MLPEELQGREMVIGSKQVKKALSQGKVWKVYLAADAEPHVLVPLKELCYEQQVEVEEVKSMILLGQACGIEVGAATAALLIEK